MVKVKEFFRHYWFFIFLAFLATIIGGLVFFFRQPTTLPQPPKLPTLVPPQFKPAQIAEGRIFYQLDLKENAPEAPDKLPFYQVQSRPSFNYPVKANLEGKSILISPTQAAGLAKGFLGQNNRFPEELNQGEYQIKFLKIGGYEVFPTDSFEKADIVAVHFYPKIGDLYIIDNNPFSALVEVWIGKNGQPQKVRDFLAEYKKTEGGDYPIISFTKAWQAIEQKGTVVSVLKQEETYSPAVVKINTIVIDKVYLAYFQPSELPSLLQPIWVFQGKAILQDGTESEVTVYLPAIEEKYFITPGP